MIVTSTINTPPPYELHKWLKVGERLYFADGALYVAHGDLGLGLFAARQIGIGSVIHQFSGPRISFSQALAKGERQCWPLQIRNRTAPDAYIDLDDNAPGCFANHSCNPNAGIFEDHILISIKAISPGEEIRFDYSTTMDENCFEMSCRCGSAECRGRVQDFSQLPPDVRAFYLKRSMVSSFVRDTLTV